MNFEQLRKVCLSLPGATEQIQWGSDLVFKVAGKMFLVVNTEPPHGYSFKCSEETFRELIELPGIIPAPYLARARWVQILPAECRLPISQISALISESYSLILSKLPRKTQLSLQSRPQSKIQRMPTKKPRRISQKKSPKGSRPRRR